MFETSLSNRLNPNHKLYKLKAAINWPRLESWLYENIEIKSEGRGSVDKSVCLRLFMLQSLYNLSDIRASEMYMENMYWHYFCGYEYVEDVNPISESTIIRFRQALGEAGMQEIMKELVECGKRIGLIKKKDLKEVIIDTTVQIKNIKHPHDAYLLEKARDEQVKLSKMHGIKLNRTYKKEFKNGMFKLWKYKKDSKAKSRINLLKKMKVRLGRLIREFARANVDLAPYEQEILTRIKKIYAQSVLTKEEKKEYKQDNKVLYSFHATEVECIGKGKLHKPYEFGNKVSVTVSGANNFVLSAKSFHGNPYDGHTLAECFADTENISQTTIKQAYVDCGYAGHNVQQKSRVITAASKRKLSNAEKKMKKRRSAVEPIIGHLKNFGRMARNYLRGCIGDILNPLISAIGLNLRNLGRYLMLA